MANKKCKGGNIMLQDDYEILTPDDVMEELQIGKNAVYNLLKSGDLKGFRVGRNWKIPIKQLEEFIDKSVEKNVEK